ncbi:hypothetical protein MLD38_030729 [Melastoma candidum]|uniref:Uncharacterized protein n=1 Tax=Melastoma candidum TaxID=119954 RepID=A0ACB9MM12_9MYRT|nr:hypothetical protein MLD38_030729 [Melastoma candidum]
MDRPAELTRLVEAYVDASRSESEQAVSLQELASLLKKDIVSIGSLTREMELYLTTTDHVIRSRGVLLLGELVSSLSSKTMEKATIHSLTMFFVDRLADWRAQRGALVGCLALLRRKGDVGMVTIGDAKAAIQSFRKNVHVQTHGQHDRLLCFELLECLLEKYPEAVMSLGNDIFYLVTEATEYEKDPDCLLLMFRVVRLVFQLFSDSSGPLDSEAEGLFDILGRYFPIYFTHSKAKDIDVKRDKLSEELMLAFACTPLFEPFAVPLLVEKLSSSVRLAKTDSLKYLSYCALKYGADRMGEHAAEIWCSLKREVLSSPQEPVFLSNSMDGLGLSDNEIAKEALAVLAAVVTQNDNIYLELLINDTDINMIFDNLTTYEDPGNIPLESKHKLYGVGRLLSITAKCSISTCNKMFECFFPKLMGNLGVLIFKASDNGFLSVEQESFRTPNFGPLYLSLVLLESCRDLIVGSNIPITEICCSLVMDFSASIIKLLSFFMGDDGVRSETVQFLCVKGLQILATFGGGFEIVSKSLLEYILTTVVAEIFVHHNSSFMWDLALKALASIGSSIDKYQEQEKVLCYMAIVVGKISSLLTSSESEMPYALKLSIASQIAMCGRSYTREIIQVLETAIFSNLTEFHADENIQPTKIVQLLDCLSRTLLPWLQESGGFEDIPEHFVLNLLEEIKHAEAVNMRTLDKDVFDAIMMSVKLSASNCTVTSQTMVIDKAYSIVSSNSSFRLAEYAVDSYKLKELHISLELDKLSTRDRLVLSLFSSIVVALRPQTCIPHVRAIFLLFMENFLKGHIPSAEALGSILNKLSSTAQGNKAVYNCSLEEAIDLIFKMSISNEQAVGHNDNRTSIVDICLGSSNSKLLQANAIVGLAWMGKGLLMRGHEKVKDITTTLVQCLLTDNTLKPSNSEGIPEQEAHSVMRCCADAFHILVSDAEASLSRRLHAVVRPLYKQRFFLMVMPIFQDLIIRSDTGKRSLLCRAFAYIISETPLIAIIGEAKKLIPVILDALLMFSENGDYKDRMYSLLLVVSGILTEEAGQDAVNENARSIVSCLTRIIQYPHMMLVRETAVQCLAALTTLPYARVYPMRAEVLQAILKALDDPKRRVREEAVRCRQAWASITA